MTVLRIALRVLCRDRRTRMSALLTAVGVAVATGLMLLVVSLPEAAQSRLDRSAWQVPHGQETGTASMLVAAGEDFHDGEKITRVDVAALGDPSGIDLPAGIDRFPGPGEVLLSPGLGDRVEEAPGSELGDRYPGLRVGVLGQDALTHPGQLVALVGHDPGELERGSPVEGFTPPGTMIDPTLTLLAGVGVVVLLVPSLVLVASAARLTAARRERRFAALRLAGATPRQVVAMVAGENTIAAVGGALIGLAASPLLGRAAATVSWQGGTWEPGDFTLPVSLLVGVVVAIPLLVLLAAVLGLRRVVRTPLGAVNGHRPRRPTWVRLLAVPVAGAFFLFMLDELDDELSLLLLLLAFALLVGSLVFIGPWLTAAIGSVFGRVWRRPSVLLAGRRLRHDPRGAYRSSAGVVLAVFTGSMALTLLPSFESLQGSWSPFRDGVFSVSAVAESDEVAERVNEALARYGSDARAVVVEPVELRGGGEPVTALLVDCESAGAVLKADLEGACDGGPAIYGREALTLGAEASLVRSDGEVRQLDPRTPVRTVELADEVDESVIIDSALVTGSASEGAAVAVAAKPGEDEVVRTALALATNGQQVLDTASTLSDQRSQLADLRRVTVIGLVVAGLLSGCSAAITTAGSVLDRRRTLGALLAAGTPVRVLSRALRTEAAMPALVATIGAGGMGVFVAVGLFGLLSEESPVITPWVSAPVVLGLGAAVIAASVCTPALNRVSAEPLSDE